MPAILCCLLTFHSPDGSPLVVEEDAIKVVKPIAAKHHDHLTKKVNSVVYFGGSTSFGIVETVSEALRMMERCGTQQQPQGD